MLRDKMLAKRQRKTNIYLQRRDAIERKRHDQNIKVLQDVLVAKEKVRQYGSYYLIIQSWRR